MVSAVQLQQQQQKLRQVRSGLSLRQQQQALRKGISPQQFVRQEEQKIRDRVQSQVTSELKTQGKDIDDILKNVNSIQQFREIVKEIPMELRQFIKVNEASLRQDLQGRIKQVQDRIKSKQGKIPVLEESRRNAIADKNQTRASRLESEIRGLTKEVQFLQGVLPRFNAGELLPINQVFSIGRDVGLSEEDKRKALSEQFKKLSEKSGISRKEISEIIRTQTATQQQLVSLGLFQAQVPSMRDTTDLEVKSGLAPSVIERERIKGIFGITSEPTELEKALGLDFSKLGRLPKEKGLVEKAKEFIPKIVDIQKPFGLAPGVSELGGFGIKKGVDIITKFEKGKQRPPQKDLSKTETRKLRFENEKQIIIDLVGGESRFETFKEFEERVFRGELTGFSLGESGFKGLEFIEKFVPRKIPITGITGAEVDISGFVESEVSLVTKKEAIELLDAVIKFQIFSPLLTAGVVAKGKQVKKVQKTKLVKKADKKTIKKVVDLLEDSFKRGELKNELIKLSDGIIKNPNLVQKNLQIQNLNSLLDEALRRGLIRNFFIDSKTGAIAFTDNAGTLFRVGTKLAPEIELQIEAILFESPKISTTALSATGSGIGLGESKFQDLTGQGKISSLDVGKIGGLGELGKFKALDLQDISKSQKEQQKNFNKLFEGILTIPKQTAKEKARQKELSKLGISQLEIPKQTAKEKALAKTGLSQIEVPKLDQPTAQVPKQPQIPKQPQFPIPKFPTPQFPDITFDFPIPGFPRTPGKPPKEPPGKPFLIPFILPKKKRKQELSEFNEGFDLFIKSKGKNKKIESNINMDNVLDIGSFITDNSISQQFSFKETGRKAKPPKLQVPRNYWELNQNKFNNFRIKQGKKIPLINTFKEKRINAIDTIGELQQLSASRLLAQQRKENRKMDRLANNLSRGFNNSFNQPKQQKQPQQRFKQVDISKTINFNVPKRRRKKRK